MYKLKSQNPSTVSRTIILPVVGKVSFDKENCIEVKSLEDAEELVSIDSLSLQFLEEKKSEKLPSKKKEVVVEDEKLVEEVIEDEDKTEIELAKKIELIENINSIKELRELAEGTFPEKEWKNIKSKAQMKEYLIEKIKNA